MLPSQPGFAGTDDGLGAVRDLKLGEDVGDVIAHGLGAQVEAFGDLGVRLVAGYELQDLVLALGQLGEGVGGLSRVWTREILHEAAGYGRSEDGLAAGDSPDGTQDLGLEGAFKQVASGTGLQRGEHRIVILLHADDEDAYVGAGVQDRTGRLDAVDPGHTEVHQDHVRLERFGEREGLPPVARLAYYLEVGRGEEQGTQPVTEVGMVIGDELPDLLQGYVPPCKPDWSLASIAQGKSAVTLVPPEATASMLHEPPSSSALSRMEERPTPGS